MIVPIFIQYFWSDAEKWTAECWEKGCQGGQRTVDRPAAWFCWCRLSHCVQISPWVFKGPWWDKTWGNSYNSWPENFDWISFVFWWRQGTDWTCLAHPTAEETSVTRAVESDRQKEMSYRKIAGETAALKLPWRGAVWADWVWGGREVPIEN